MNRGEIDISMERCKKSWVENRSNNGVGGEIDIDGYWR